MTFQLLVIRHKHDNFRRVQGTAGPRGIGFAEKTTDSGTPVVVLARSGVWGGFGQSHTRKFMRLYCGIACTVPVRVREMPSHAYLDLSFSLDSTRIPVRYTIIDRPELSK